MASMDWAKTTALQDEKHFSFGFGATFTRGLTVVQYHAYWWHGSARSHDIDYSISQEICTRFVVLCFVVVMQLFIMNSHEVFIHIHQGCFAGTGAIVRLPQCQWSKPDGYGKISQCITTTKHSKAKTVCIFLGIYCTLRNETGPWLSSIGLFLFILENLNVV